MKYLATGNSNPSVERLALTINEACDALGVSRVSLWRLEKLGRITPIDTGRRLKLYSVSELKRFTETTQTAGKGAAAK